MKLVSTVVSSIKIQSSASLLLPLLALGLSFGVSDQAFARDVCKNVSIKIENGTSDTVKVTKFEYFDFDKNKYRTENLLGVDGQEKLNPGKSFTQTRDLGQVGNDRTKFRVTYRHQQGGIKFENPVSVTTPSFTCTNNSSQRVLLNK